ncbi:MAG: hypothetical protein C0621_00760 [Desulfuromonas sp.]|nr:MAG: hypothetical protein C0621_00760 [Desulfuromonas sp.]
MRIQGKPLFLQFWSLYTVRILSLALLTMFGMVGCAGLRGITLPGSPIEQRRLALSLDSSLVQLAGGLYRDEALQAYLQEKLQLVVSGGTMIPATFWRLRFLNDSTPRLLALPGGELFLSRGLLSGLQSENEILTLLAHAVAHADLGHLPRGEGMEIWPRLLVPAEKKFDTHSLAKEKGRAAKALLSGRYGERQEELVLPLMRRLLLALGKEPAFAPWSYTPEGDLPAALWESGFSQRHPLALAESERNEVITPSSARFDAAFAQIRKATAAYALFDEAMASERDGDLKRAIALYLQAASAAPEESPFYLALGRCYLQSGDLPSSRRFFAQALKKGGDDAEARLGLGYISLQQKDYDVARHHLEKSQSLLPTARSDYLLGELWDEEGEKERAADFYRRVLADPVASETLRRSATNRLRKWGIKP